MGVLETCGHHLVHTLRCADVAVAKAAMFMLYDMVTFGEVSDLAECTGCIKNKKK